MAVQCTYCGRSYDVTLFEFGMTVVCGCGRTIGFRHERMSDETRLARSAEDRAIKEIRAMADRISSLIVASDYPMIDIEIEKQRLREKIAELFPDKAGLYDLIYEPRFRRLEEQFRE